jgi:hypothetical protein
LFEQLREDLVVDGDAAVEPHNTARSTACAVAAVTSNCKASNLLQIECETFALLFGRLPSRVLYNLCQKFKQFSSVAGTQMLTNAR